MARHGEAVVGVGPGLAPWQFYGPSTRRGSSVYVFCLMRPYDSVVVRGIPTARVERVVLVSTGQALSWRTRTSILDRLTEDRMGEIRVPLSRESVDNLATVLRIDFQDPDRLWST
jgi:alpha-L-fucosidase